ncbi:hypothetical protein [Lewinella sp. IMCC34191]|uniref:hypothetical protein n=1 Tax=Lewinella sp. IMCC34191 TaxID=2259172 RepID=UPI000E2785C7|nr:hypothetical protein [Lewinella sp. IMCC34191]
MIHRIRHSNYLRLFWGVMAAGLLNLSVDAPDMFAHHVPEDLTHNDQESIIELIVEMGLGFEDAFAEYDDDDRKEKLGNGPAKVIALLTGKLDVVLHPPLPTPGHRGYPPYADRQSAGHHRIDAPPPRA